MQCRKIQQKVKASPTYERQFEWGKVQYKAALDDLISDDIDVMEVIVRETQIWKHSLVAPVFFVL